jgi:hypothetical protein
MRYSALCERSYLQRVKLEAGAFRRGCEQAVVVSSLIQTAGAFGKPAWPVSGLLPGFGGGGQIGPFGVSPLSHHWRRAAKTDYPPLKRPPAIPRQRVSVCTNADTFAAFTAGERQHPREAGEQIYGPQCGHCSDATFSESCISSSTRCRSAAVTCFTSPPTILHSIRNFRSAQQRTADLEIPGLQIPDAAGCIRNIPDSLPLDKSVAHSRPTGAEEHVKPKYR